VLILVQQQIVVPLHTRGAIAADFVCSRKQCFALLHGHQET